MVKIICQRYTPVGKKPQWETTRETTLEELRKSPDPSQGFCYTGDIWSSIRISFEGDKGEFGVMNFRACGKDHIYDPKHLFLISTQYGKDIEKNVEHVWPNNWTKCDDQGGYTSDKKTGKRVYDTVAEDLIQSCGDVDRNQTQFFKKLCENGYIGKEMHEAMSLILHHDQNLEKEHSEVKTESPEKIGFFAWLRGGRNG